MNGIRKTILLIALSAAFLALFTAEAFGVEARNIAVSRVGSTSAILVVKADVTADVTIEYGAAPGVYGSMAQSSGQIRHEVLLDPLAPSSTVYYRVTITDSADPGSTITLPEKSFHTSRNAGEPFSYTVAGDNRPASNTTVQPAVWNTIVQQMSDEGPDLFLNVGDIIYGASSDTLAQNVAKYDGLFAVTAQLTASAPLYQAIGNHEYVSYANSRAGYEQEFAMPVNNGADAATYGEHYYSFDHGDTHFIALSTEIPGQLGFVTGNQKAWLEQDLAADSSKWIVIFMHRPLFSGTHLNDPWVNAANVAGQQNKTDIHNLFVEHGVDIVFEGHDHYYLRHEQDGIQYIITGGGGAPLGGVPAPGAGDVFGASTYEHVRVDESADSIGVTAVDSAGASLESFTVGMPQLSLSHLQTYWATYAAYLDRNLSVDYSLSNSGPGDAVNLQVEYLTATNGVTPRTPAPFGLNGLDAGQSTPFTVSYGTPSGVSAFKASLFVSCNDLGGTAYSFPGPAPAY